MNSILDSKVKKELVDFIDQKVEEALKADDVDHASNLQEAKRLIERGAAKVRKENPYANWLGDCIPKQENKGREAMGKCALQWNKLGENEKKKWGKGELEVYDYS